MKKLVVLGGGESGVGAALLAQRNHWDVFVSDMGSLSPSAKEIFKKNKIHWEDGTHSVERIIQAELVVKSPGIPNHAAVIKTIEGAGITIISEIEFASNYTDATIIGITGSNGKTTTSLTSGIYMTLR